LWAVLQSRSDEAILWLEKARSANPRLAMVRDSLAAAYTLTGETERAATELDEARRLSGDDRYSSIARWKASRYWGVPKIRALNGDRIQSQLRIRDLRAWPVQVLDRGDRGGNRAGRASHSPQPP
jgi:hypothetical protein